MDIVFTERLCVKQKGSDPILIRDIACKSESSFLYCRLLEEW